MNSSPLLGLTPTLHEAGAATVVGNAKETPRGINKGAITTSPSKIKHAIKLETSPA